MRLRDCGFLADQNLHVDVVAWMRSVGLDVLSTGDERMSRSSDEAILERAVSRRRVVVTHDADFGRLSIAEGKGVFGIIYIRPGHVRSEPVIRTLQSVLETFEDVRPPFILVAQWKPGNVVMRLRQAAE